jgi:hypothetical protein
VLAFLVIKIEYRRALHQSLASAYCPPVIPSSPPPDRETDVADLHHSRYTPACPGGRLRRPSGREPSLLSPAHVPCKQRSAILAPGCADNGRARYISNRFWLTNRNRRNSLKTNDGAISNRGQNCMSGIRTSHLFRSDVDAIRASARSKPEQFQHIDAPLRLCYVRAWSFLEAASEASHDPHLSSGTE